MLQDPSTSALYSLVGCVRQISRRWSWWTHPFLPSNIFSGEMVLLFDRWYSQPETLRIDDGDQAINCGALRYIYTGNMSLGSLKEDLILDILGLAHLYGFQELETSISEYLKAVLSVRTVCLIYDTASLYQVTSLILIRWFPSCLRLLAGLSLYSSTCFHGPSCC